MNDHNAIRRFGRYEAAARAYCRARNLDPEERIQHGSAEFSDRGARFYTANVIYTARWLFVARRFAKFEERLKDDKTMRKILKDHPPATAPAGAEK